MLLAYFFIIEYETLKNLALEAISWFAYEFDKKSLRICAGRLLDYFLRL